MRVHAELLLQIGQRGAAQVDLGLVVRCEIRPVALGRLRVRNRVAVLGFVLAVEHEWNLVQQRHLRRQCLLSEDERLERVKQVFHRQSRDQPVHTTVRRAKEIVETGVKPRLEVFPTPFGVDVGRPGHRQRVHAVFVLQHVRRVETVLAAGPRHDAVVTAVLAAVAIAQVDEFAFALGPVDGAVLLLSHAAGVADALGIEVDRFLLAVLGVCVFHGRIGPLIRNDTLSTKGHVHGKAVTGRLRHVGLERREINLAATWIEVHRCPPELGGQRFRSLRACRCRPIAQAASRRRRLLAQ